MTEGAFGHIFAHGVLLRLLTEKVKESDPAFEDHARLVFDTHLGQYLESVGSPGPMEVEARKVFNAIILNSK